MPTFAAKAAFLLSISVPFNVFGESPEVAAAACILGMEAAASKTANSIRQFASACKTEQAQLNIPTSAMVPVPTVVDFSCSAQACADIPPQHRLISVSAIPFVSRGSNNGWDGPHFVPNRENVEKVCFNVWATSPGIPTIPGEQIIFITLYTRSPISAKEKAAMVADCLAAAN